ncbi:SPOR domain-containing protein [Flavobacterium sp. 20NA77.7]|uniref:SPOR domain-containing protein n=1 Tax=Flavobacterium nakdongensis TaxID=3073563 RepID=A0ABY9RA33_9FLAO|nr:SPOR domain-containing protein [Flavobacterium sp. 20NA77.7]WMW77659.1 SPOR domain-containing protein [Flavobacterium sp. 20NA77.7]
MKTLKNNVQFLLVLTTILIWQNIFSMKRLFSFQQDPKVEQLLAEKRKANAAITINDKYKIQIFFGSIEDSKKNLTQFKKEFKDTDGTIVFSNPSYKVWVGSYKSKIEAEKALIGIKKKFPSALLINPNKK